MDIYTAILLFFGGAFAHAFFSKLLGINNKLRIYRIALINCLGITKYACGNAEQFLIHACETDLDKTYVGIAIQHWKNLSVASLKTSVPQEVWMSMGINDWGDVEKLIKRIEDIGDQNEVE